MIPLNETPITHTIKLRILKFSIEKRENKAQNANGRIKNKKKKRFSDLLYRSGFYNITKLHRTKSYTFVTSYLIELEEDSREETVHHLIPTKYLPEKFWTK